MARAEGELSREDSAAEDAAEDRSGVLPAAPARGGDATEARCNIEARVDSAPAHTSGERAMDALHCRMSGRGQSTERRVQLNAQCTVACTPPHAQERSNTVVETMRSLCMVLLSTSAWQSHVEKTGPFLLNQPR